MASCSASVSLNVGVAGKTLSPALSRKRAEGANKHRCYPLRPTPNGSPRPLAGEGLGGEGWLFKLPRRPKELVVTLPVRHPQPTQAAVHMGHKGLRAKEVSIHIPSFW